MEYAFFSGSRRVALRAIILVIPLFLLLGACGARTGDTGFGAGSGGTSGQTGVDLHEEVVYTLTDAAMFIKNHPQLEDNLRKGTDVSSGPLVFYVPMPSSGYALESIHFTNEDSHILFTLRAGDSSKAAFSWYFCGEGQLWLDNAVAQQGLEELESAPGVYHYPAVEGEMETIFFLSEGYYFYGYLAVEDLEAQAALGGPVLIPVEKVTLEG